MIENLIRNFSFEGGLSDWDVVEGRRVRITSDAFVGSQALVLPPGSLVTQQYKTPGWATSDLLFFFKGYGMIEVTIFYEDGITSMEDVGGASTDGFTPIWFPVKRTRPVTKIQLSIVQGKEIIVDGFMLLGWVPYRFPAFYSGPYVSAVGPFDDQTRTFLYAQMLEDRLMGIESKLISLLNGRDAGMEVKKKKKKKKETPSGIEKRKPRRTVSEPVTP